MRTSRLTVAEQQAVRHLAHVLADQTGRPVDADAFVRCLERGESLDQVIARFAASPAPKPLTDPKGVSRRVRR